MILESLIIGATVLSIANKEVKNSNKYKLKEKFNQYMSINEIKNGKDESFSIKSISKIEKNMFDVDISIPVGLDIFDFRKIIPKLENWSRSFITIRCEDEECIKARFIIPETEDEMMFRKNFNAFMFHNNNSSSKNSTIQYFNVLKYIKTLNGCKAIVGIPPGKDWFDMQELIPSMEIALNSEIYCEMSKNKTSLYMVFIDRDKVKTSLKKDIITMKWYKIMANCSKSKDKSLRNINGETFIIDDYIENEDYGFDLIISAPSFISINNLKEYLDTIKTTFKASEVFYEYNTDKNNIKLTVVEKPFPDKLPYEPVKCNFGEVYMGMNIAYKKLFANTIITPHIGVYGTSGTGKTTQMMMLITNIIYNNNAEIYFSDLSDQADFSNLFEKCECVKYYADNLQKSIALFNYLDLISRKRAMEFKRLKVRNVKQYNKKSDKPMKMIFLVLDEFGDYLPIDKNSDGEENYKLKKQALLLLKEGARKWRKYGIQQLVGIQRPTCDLLDPTMKSLFTNVCAFRQMNGSSSHTACDDAEALVGIPDRYGLFISSKERTWFKSLYVDDDNEILLKVLKPFMNENHKYINIGKATSKLRENNKDIDDMIIEDIDDEFDNLNEDNTQQPLFNKEDI